MARATKPTSSKAKEVEESVSTQMNDLLTANSTVSSTTNTIEDTAVNIETPKESVEVKETPSSTGSFDMAQFAQMFQQMQNQMQEQINKLQEQLVSTTEKLNEKKLVLHSLNKEVENEFFDYLKLHNFPYLS